MSKTVLIVDDEEDLRELLREALEPEGVRVLTASEGFEALELLAKGTKPCLILLDLLMPGMNGWDTFGALRASPALALIPVVFVTSAPKLAPQHGAGILKKPFEIEEVSALIARFCR